MHAPVSRLLDAAARAPNLVAWRQAALQLLSRGIPFDAALFHELSPRAPIAHAAIVGIDPLALWNGRLRWDENAVALGRLRDLALSQNGVASDDQAFPPRSRGRREWNARVAGPLRLRSVLVGHLVLRNRIIAVVMLGRRRGPCFDAHERRLLTRWLPALSVGDALLQSLENQRLGGATANLECVDQRLTPRQRQVVVQVALGQTNAEIGQALGISEHTVRNLLVQVRARLGAANRAEVVRLAVLRLG